MKPQGNMARKLNSSSQCRLPLSREETRAGPAVIFIPGTGSAGLKTKPARSGFGSEYGIVGIVLVQYTSPYTSREQTTEGLLMKFEGISIVLNKILEYSVLCSFDFFVMFSN